MNAPAATKTTVVLAPNAVEALVPDDVVTLSLYTKLSGLSARAVYGKIDRGQWLAGRQFHKDETGAIWIIRSGVRKWVAGS
jgi:hypothetical protein